ncbi:MAG: efflux RND transporter periplasmic adaptor subunit [Sphingomonadales bacterium]
MNKRMIMAVSLLLTGLAAGYSVGRFHSEEAVTTGAGEVERKVLYWQAPMDPSFRRDKPGKSPTGMDLVPVYEGDEADQDENALRISPAVVNNLGVRTAPALSGSLSREIDTVGFITPDDDLTSHLHVRAEGWVERLLVKTEGERVKKGDLLFQMYSPKLVNAQTEYLQALRIKQSGLAAASRERLKALGMTAGQIARLKKSGKVEELLDVLAPQDGVIVALNIGEGMFIKPGTTVAALADLSSIWVLVEVYEDQAGWVEARQQAVMRLPFLPGRRWEGVVDYIYPTVDPVSRTVRIRLKFANPGELLKPNMYSEIQLLGTATGPVIHIPREALIRTGKAERVILALGNGRFRPAGVTSGIESAGRIEIISGLKEGDMVVTSGQFLLDSEASLRASFLRMEEGDSQ